MQNYIQVFILSHDRQWNLYEAEIEEFAKKEVDKIINDWYNNRKEVNKHE